MDLFGEEYKIRPADLGDLDGLTRLIQRKSFIHQHLGWYSPFDWLGQQPFYIVEGVRGMLAALACPPDEDGTTWLRMFAVSPGVSVPWAWNLLWPPVRDWLQKSSSTTILNSLVIQDEMQELLAKSGFQEANQVVVLVWELANASWPIMDKELIVSEMGQEDLVRIHEIDQTAFEFIWRNSLNQLQTALQTAFYASTVSLNGQIAGYQISTVNPHGGHLARLAVDPVYQKQGIAKVLLGNLLERFQSVGIVEVTVNTQSKNQASLDLYKKFGFIRAAERYPVLQYNLKAELSGTGDVYP